MHQLRLRKGFSAESQRQAPDEVPKCGKETLVKELSAPGFELKGTGWAATDFSSGHKSLPAAHAAKKN